MKDENLMHRMKDLISGFVEPQDRTEDFFVISYREAVSGKDLMEVYLDNVDDLLTMNETAAFISGYSVGQMKLREFEQQAEDAKKEGTMQ